MARRVQSFEYDAPPIQTNLEPVADLPQRSNSFTAYISSPFHADQALFGRSSESTPITQDDDFLALKFDDVLDSSMFDQNVPLNTSQFVPEYFDIESSPGFDSQQDLLESQRLTALLEDNPYRSIQLDPEPNNISVRDPRLYDNSYNFTHSSPALISPPVSRTVRTLPRRKSRYGLYQAGRRAVSIPQPIRQSDERRERDNMFETPLERWRNSPPDSDPAPISAIHQEHERRLLDPTYTHDIEASSHDQVWTGYRTPSRANSTTGSEASEVSVTSNASDKSSASQRARKISQKRKSRLKKQRDTSEMAGERMFKCTFCCDDFKHKYDWARHEKSLHLNIGGWRCAPFGPIVTSPSNGRLVCAFCNILDPSSEHIEMHNYKACLRTLGGSHVFQRKDHLTQHLRLVHHLEANPLIDDWKVQAPSIRSRCGICDTVMTSWDERTEHLAIHFRDGKSMEDWQGDHGLEDTIAAQVTNALPPWLIKFESKSIIPFSATNSASRDQYRQHLVHAAKLGNSISQAQLEDGDERISMGYANVSNPHPEGRVSFELLVSHLSRFAREQMALGAVPTDEMFQKEARKLFYDDDDEWNQTVADDLTWLSAFRQQNQFNINPNS